MVNRRDFLKLLLATPLAATVDVEQLLWVPKPIIVVPAMPGYVFYGGARGGGKANIGRIIVAAWEDYVRNAPLENIQSHFYRQLHSSPK